jgi:hypothetical protein
MQWLAELDEQIGIGKICYVIKHFCLNINPSIRNYKGKIKQPLALKLYE